MEALLRTSHLPLAAAGPCLHQVSEALEPGSGALRRTRILAGERVLCGVERSIAQYSVVSEVAT